MGQAGGWRRREEEEREAWGGVRGWVKNSESSKTTKDHTWALNPQGSVRGAPGAGQGPKQPGGGVLKQ